MPIEMRAGYEVHSITFGNGPEPALMIHAALSGAAAWKPLADQLADRFSMTAFDMPGHGKSQPWPADGSSRGEYHSAVTQIAATYLDQHAEPFNMLGHSFGATVALRLAQLHPEKVRTLTLIEPVFFASYFAKHPDWKAEYDAAHFPFIEAYQCGDHALAAELFMALWGDGTPWQDMPEKIRDHFTQKMHLVLAGQPSVYEDTHGIAEPGRLEAIASPVHLIRGDRSNPAMAHVHHALLERLPNAKETVISGAGHMVPMTHPVQISAALQQL